MKTSGKKNLDQFYIDLEYCTQIIVTTAWYPKFANSTPEDDLMFVLSSTPYKSIGTRDHPEFAKLRKTLDDNGYIDIIPGWINGDIVTKPFILNTKEYKVGDKFPCASAVGMDLKNAESS